VFENFVKVYIFRWKHNLRGSREFGAEIGGALPPDCLLLAGELWYVPYGTHDNGFSETKTIPVWRFETGKEIGVVISDRPRLPNELSFGVPVWPPDEINEEFSLASLGPW
jgi:hypothetical protein